MVEEDWAADVMRGRRQISGHVLGVIGGGVRFWRWRRDGRTDGVCCVSSLTPGRDVQ